MSADNADLAPVVNQDASRTAQAEPAAEQTIEQATPEAPRSTENIMDRMGLPEEVKQQLREKQQTPEPQAEADQPEAETPEEEPVEEPADTEPEKEDPEATAEETKQWPEKAIKLKDRYRRQRNQARDEAAELREQLADAQTKLESAQPVTVAPTLNDPLAHVTDMKGLESEFMQAENLRNFCIKNANGYMANEGTDQEKWIPPEVIADKHIEANDVLTKFIPLKAQQIAARPKYTEQAKQVMPTMFEPGHDDYKAARNMKVLYPFLANDPRADELIAVQLKGWKAIQAEQAQKPSKNGQGKPELELPAELVRSHQDRNKVPVLKNLPPSRPNGSSLPAQAKAAQTAQQAALQSGDRDAILAAVRARRESGSERVNSRSPALV